MLSPTPLSLCCALLLCLPLAIVFTITTPASTTSTAAANNDTIIITTTNTNKTSNKSPKRIFFPGVNNRKLHTNTKIKNNTLRSPPPPASSSSSTQPASLPEDDESLFRLAARVNSNPSPPATPKKLAFMFLTTTPLPLAPLWELFFLQNQTNTTKLFNIYVHADPSFNYTPPFSGVFSGRVIPSKPTQRFTPSQIAAARRLLAHALLHDPSNAMFALISPSCVPLHSFNFTYRTLVRSKKSFIEILSNEPGSYDRYAARGPDAMLPEVPFSRFRIGSQFFVLSRKHARLVVKDEQLWSKFKLPCVRRDTCYPEEHYFSTLLSMRDRRGCVPATLTHVDWKGRHDGHPRTYMTTDVGPELIHSLRQNRPRYGYEERPNGSDSSVFRRHDPFLFARKFSSDSLQPLMAIASDVIFRD